MNNKYHPSSRPPTVMARAHRRSARAKALVRLYTRLRRDYERRKHRHISRLKRLHHLLSVPSTDHLSLSSLSSLSSSSTSSDRSDTTGDEETTSEDSWADVLGSNWRGRWIQPSDVSLDSEVDILDVSSQQDHDADSSSISGYSADADSSFRSDVFETSDNEDTDDDSGGDRWARLRRWVHQHIAEMYANRYEMPRTGIPRGPS